jgi:hypothetical protein
MNNPDLLWILRDFHKAGIVAHRTARGPEGQALDPALLFAIGRMTGIAESAVEDYERRMGPPPERG